MGVKEIVVKMRNYLCECEDNSCDIDSEIYSCQIDQLEAEIERDGELLDYNKISPFLMKYIESGNKIELVKGTEVVMSTLKANQSVMYGDGKTYHILITKP